MDNTDKSIDGYIYIVYNEVYQHYGDNVFKLGKSKDVIARLKGYITSYVKPVELKFVSKLCKDCARAEKTIFTRLDNYRIVNNREFFKIDKDFAIDIIEQVIDEINGNDYQQNESKIQELEDKVKQYEDKVKQYEDKVKHPYTTLQNKEEIIKDLVIMLDISGDKELKNHELLENIEKLKGRNIFTYDESYYNTFNTSKARLDELFVNSLKSKLGFINTILKVIS